jgi:hypothetical protein
MFFKKKAFQIEIAPENNEMFDYTGEEENLNEEGERIIHT